MENYKIRAFESSRVLETIRVVNLSDEGLSLARIFDLRSRAARGLVQITALTDSQPISKTDIGDTFISHLPGHVPTHVRTHTRRSANSPVFMFSLLARLVVASRSQPASRHRMNNGFLLIEGDSPTSLFESIMYDLYLYAPNGTVRDRGRWRARDVVVREEEKEKEQRKGRRNGYTEERDGERLHDTRAYDLDRNKSRLRPDFKA